MADENSKEIVFLKGADLKMSGAREMEKWINTPYSYTRVLAGQSRLEQDVLLQVSEHIQSCFEPFYASGNNKLELRPNPLFVGRAKEKMLEPIRVKLSEYGIKPNHYDLIRKAIESILNIKWVIPVNTNQGLVYSMVNVFSRGSTEYDTESGNAGMNRGYIDFFINPDMADYAFDMSMGYVQHPRKIARNSKVDYSTLLYMLVKHYCGLRIKCEIPFLEIKKHLGFVVRDTATDRILSYTNIPYWRFKERVIDKAIKDIEAMAARGQIDCSFKYSEIRPDGKQRGEPTALEFTLVPTAMGKARAETKRADAKKTKLINTMLKRYPDLSAAVLAEIVDRVPAKKMKAFADFAYKDLAEMIERSYPEDVPGYVARMLNRWIDERMIAADPQSSMPNLFTEAPVSDDGMKIVPGEFASEYARICASCPPQYKAWLDKARFIGSQRGGVLIEFPDRKTHDAFNDFEADKSNAAVVAEFRAMYDQVMGRPMAPFVRSYKKLKI